MEPAAAVDLIRSGTRPRICTAANVRCPVNSQRSLHHTATSGFLAITTCKLVNGVLSSYTLSRKYVTD